MKNIFIFSFCLLSIVYSLSSHAAETKTESATAAAPAPPPATVESEKAKSWKGLEAQEQWVARLNKQIGGETRQLSEMRAALAQKYKLELKTLEVGGYAYDEEKDEFVER